MDCCDLNYTYIEAIHVGPGMFEWGRGEMGGEFVGPPLEKKSEFKIQVLKSPMFTEMTEKHGIYFHFLYQQGDIPRWC